MNSTAAMKVNNLTVTIYGNVGNDPDYLTFDARTEIVRVYDPSVDDIVEKLVSFPASSAMRFSVAVNYKEKNKNLVRWINVFDPEELACKNLLRKGDRVKITGYFRTRQGVDNETGEPKEFRNFILQALQVEKRKTREVA